MAPVTAFGTALGPQLAQSGSTVEKLSQATPAKPPPLSKCVPCFHSGGKDYRIDVLQSEYCAAWAKADPGKAVPVAVCFHFALTGDCPLEGKGHQRCSKRHAGLKLSAAAKAKALVSA